MLRGWFGVYCSEAMLRCAREEIGIVSPGTAQQQQCMPISLGSVPLCREFPVSIACHPALDKDLPAIYYNVNIGRLFLKLAGNCFHEENNISINYIQYSERMCCQPWNDSLLAR